MTHSLSVRALLRQNFEGLSRTLHRALAACAMLVLLGEVVSWYVPAAVRAQDEPKVTSSLIWFAPPTSPCPSRDHLVEAVEQRLGRSVFGSEESADVSLHARVLQRGAAWLVHLELRDQLGNTLGTREVRSQGERCAGVAESLPIVVALLIDLPRRDVAPKAVAPRELPAPVPMRSAAASMKQAPPHARAASAPLQVSLALGGDVSYGLLPGLTVGGLLGAGIATARGISVELIGSSLGPTNARPKGGQGEARFLRPALEVLVCVPIGQTTRLSACAGADVGPVLARGQGFDRNARGARFLPELDVGLRLQQPLRAPWFVRVDVGASFPLVRERFVFRDQSGTRQTLHEPATVVPCVAVLLGVWLR